MVAQCRELLLLVTGDSEIDDDGLEMFCTAAKAKALAIGGAVAEHASDDRFPEAAVTSTVYKYRFYLAKRKEGHELFGQWVVLLNPDEEGGARALQPLGYQHGQWPRPQ